jgi:hypothetical protein
MSMKFKLVLNATCLAFKTLTPALTIVSVSCRSGVKNPIQVALHLAKEQIAGSSLLGRIPPM